MELKYDVTVLQQGGAELQSVATAMAFSTRGLSASAEAAQVQGTLAAGAVSGAACVSLAASALAANELACKNLQLLGENTVRTAEEVDAADQRAAASLHAVRTF